MWCEFCDMYCCEECCWKCGADACRRKVCVMHRGTCRKCNESVCWACLSGRKYRVCKKCEEFEKLCNEPIFALDFVA